MKFRQINPIISDNRSESEPPFELVPASLFAKSIYIVFLCYFFFIPIAFCASPLILEKGNHSPLLLEMEILEDPSGDLTIEDVRAPEFSSQFKISPTHRPNFGFTQSAFWFRFQIKNPESYSHTVALENYAVYDQIQLHQFTDDQYRFQNKELFSMVISQKPRWDLFVFELEFAPHQTKTFYLRVTSAITLQFVPKIWEPDLLRELRLKEHFYFGLLWGFLGILAVFNIYIYLTLRDRAFLYYAAYLICLIFYRMEANWWDTIYVFSFIPRVC